MAVSLTVLKEAGGEPRVAATPETVKKMSALGIKVTVEAGAGAGAGAGAAPRRRGDGGPDRVFRRRGRPPRRRVAPSGSF